MQTSYLPDYTLSGIQEGYGSMLRNDYADITNRFQPMEASLLSQYSNSTGFDNDALGYASNGVSDAIGRAGAYLEREQRNGRVLDADEQAAQDRRLNLAGGAAMSGTRSGILQSLDNRDDQIQNSLLNFANQDRSQALGQMGYLNGLGVSRDASNNALNQNARDQRNNAIGGALGTFASVAMTGNPITGAVLGGVSLLGSLF